MLSIESKLLNKKAFVVFYDEDLSSKEFDVCIINSKIVEKIMNSWLAIAITKEGNECVYHVISRGTLVNSYHSECVYLYPDKQSILRKDPRLARKMDDML